MFCFFDNIFIFVDLSGERRMRGIDVNMPAAEVEEELGASSPNSTVSSLSGKRSENEVERDRDSSYEDEDGGDVAARKKLRLSKEQAAMLEETFKEHNTLNPVSGILVILLLLQGYICQGGFLGGVLVIKLCDEGNHEIWHFAEAKVGIGKRAEFKA